ncbi:hypothetical protein DEF23_07455 [Marinitenerispora sediminis]|uniref:Uncharacterized protein n=1 Tax=Marinitenerispora sediminis TaxID=1931232 RepID=A0A368SZS7_9ACTN|nr:hypothetical protein DEF28_17890 [Marinitenerispora sediminis]RCV51746.1 hypothetical protein DEF24_22830 [Marinitenerispora sediminis]RCV59387.1 hypothetical protein DEF23_07455 [Marinitenerispora sediminis]
MAAIPAVAANLTTGLSERAAAPGPSRFLRTPPPAGPAGSRAHDRRALVPPAWAATAGHLVTTAHLPSW